MNKLCKQVLPVLPFLLCQQNKSERIASPPVGQRKNKCEQTIRKIIFLLRTEAQNCTFLHKGCPICRGRIVTAPFSASSKMVADTVVLMGTPSLLIAEIK